MFDVYNESEINKSRNGSLKKEITVILRNYSFILYNYSLTSCFFIIELMCGDGRCSQSLKHRLCVRQSINQLRINTTIVETMTAIYHGVTK